MRMAAQRWAMQTEMEMENILWLRSELSSAPEATMWPIVIQSGCAKQEEAQTKKKRKERPRDKQKSTFFASYS